MPSNISVEVDFMIVDTETGEVVTINQPIRHWHTHNSVVDKHINYNHDHYYHKSAGSRLRTVFSTQGFHLIFGILMLILILSSYSQTLKTGQTITVPLEGYLRSLSEMPDAEIFNDFLDVMDGIGTHPGFEYVTPNTPWHEFSDKVWDILSVLLRVSFFIPQIIIRVINLLITLIRLVIIMFPI